MVASVSKRTINLRNHLLILLSVCTTRNNTRLSLGLGRTGSGLGRDFWETPASHRLQKQTGRGVQGRPRGAGFGVLGIPSLPAAARQSRGGPLAMPSISGLVLAWGGVCAVPASSPGRGWQAELTNTGTYFPSQPPQPSPDHRS